MSSLRATSLGVMRPPKPPCWRDFVLSTPKSITSEVVDIPEQSGRPLGARSPVPDMVETSRVAVSLPGNKPSRLVRRPRARIHRTRSEHVIHAEDLPESAFTATLANADPKGLRGRVADGRLYVEENNRRCQNWLASIEAAEPLDEVDYTTDHQTSKSSKVDQSADAVKNNQISMVTEETDTGHYRRTENYLIPLYELQHGVDVEVPEETFVWDAGINTRHPSPGFDEELCSPCIDIPDREDIEKTSESQQNTHNPSPTFSSDKLVDNAPQNRRCVENPKCDNSSGNSCVKVSKCEKLSCGKKLYKLCCDHQDAGSSSCREHDCSCNPENSGGGSMAQVTQDGALCQVDPRCSTSVQRIRSSPRPSTARKLLTDSQLSVLKQSSSD